MGYKVRKSNGDKPGNIKRDEITVDKDLARFLGVYVAEGWSDPISSAITLSFEARNSNYLLTVAMYSSLISVWKPR